MILKSPFLSGMNNSTIKFLEYGYHRLTNTYAGPRPQFIPNGFKANNGHPPGRHSDHSYDHQHHRHHHTDHHKQGYPDHHHQECTSPASLTLNIDPSAMRTS